MKYKERFLRGAHSELHAGPNFATRPDWTRLDPTRPDPTRSAGRVNSRATLCPLA